jgi:hypothetical protein
MMPARAQERLRQGGKARRPALLERAAAQRRLKRLRAGRRCRAGIDACAAPHAGCSRTEFGTGFPSGRKNPACQPPGISPRFESQMNDF